MNKKEYFNSNPNEFKLQCCVCGNFFIPQSYEQYKNLIIKSKKYNRGFFCSDECRKKKRNTNIHELTCMNCGKKYYSKRGVKTLDDPHFCSQSCSAIYNNKLKGYNSSKTEIIKCQYCNKEFRPVNNSRKFCCKNCEINYRNNQTDKLIETGANVYHKTLRAYFIRHYGRCMNPNCKWDWDSNNENNPVLELHHIDGNHKNNTLDNCILLCPNCHSLTDNYKFKNSHKSTRDRRKYYKKE